MAGRPIILVCFTGFAGFSEISKLTPILARVFGIPRSILVVPNEAWELLQTQNGHCRRAKRIIKGNSYAQGSRALLPPQ